MFKYFIRCGSIKQFLNLNKGIGVKRCIVSHISILVATYIFEIYREQSIGVLTMLACILCKSLPQSHLRLIINFESSLKKKDF